MRERIDRIRARLADEEVDAVILTDLADIRWASGFSGSNAMMVVSTESATLVTDGRYTTQARDEVANAAIVIAEASLVAALSERQVLAGYGRIAFQSDDLTVNAFESLGSAAEETTWIPVTALLVRERASKSEDELTAIRRAQYITETVFTAIVDAIRPGMSERDLAAKIVYEHLSRGAERMSFDPIVAFGPNAARPHARPSGRALERGDVILLDFGCVVDGYASDMTRTLVLGEPERAFREAYDVVLRAQERAIEAARPGMAARDLDDVARSVIAKAGFGDAFSHSLGHGIGLETHEWPRVGRTSDDVLPEHCVITVEPGVYLADRWGIRIEDMIMLREEGAENLTSAPKDLIVL